MPDINNTLEAARAKNDVIGREARSAVSRSGFQATNPEFGLNRQALGTLTGGTLPQQPVNIAAPMTDPVKLLQMQAESKEKPLSLDTLTEEQKDKIKKSFVNCREIADKHYTSVVEPIILRRRDVYNATPEHYDKVFPGLSELSRWCSKDIKTSCEWILAGLMEAFTGSDDPLSVKGVNVDDDETANKIQQLIKYQLEKKNSYYQFCHAELKLALAENFGVAKVWWKREEERRPMEMMLDLRNDDEAIIALIEGVARHKIEITKVEDIEDAEDFVRIEYDEIIVKANHPVIEQIPVSELRYTPDAPDIQDCKFVAHRKIVTGDYLKRRERDGIYKDVDKALEEYGRGDTMATLMDRRNDPDRTEPTKKPSDSDNASKEVELYEAYLQVDYNNDGIYENLIVHAIGNNLVRVVENDFEFPPFFICSAIYDPNTVFCRDSIADSLEQHQDLKTAVIRQIIINVGKNNSPRYFVDETKVDMDALMNNEEIIPTMGSPEPAIFVPPSLPLSSISMELVNYAQTEIEAQSGSTRYNQGLDSNSLNKTATGVTAILGASEKRNKMIARAIAEKFFIPIYKFVILLNQKYLEDEQIIRLTNETVRIRRDELDIDYDLIVNVGQGAGTKEAQIQYLMIALNQIYPILAQQGIVNAKSWYNLVVKLLEALGLRDVGQYLIDPESPEAQEAARQAQEAAAAAQAQALQNSLQLSIARYSIPRMTINYEDLPPDAQVKYLQQQFGITTTEKAIAEAEVLKNNA